MLTAQGGACSLENSGSPEFTGRVVAALARDPKLMERTGKVLVPAALAEELGVADIGSRRPRPLRVLRPPETSLPAQREFLLTCSAC